MLAFRLQDVTLSVLYFSKHPKVRFANVPQRQQTRAAVITGRSDAPGANGVMNPGQVALRPALRPAQHREYRAAAAGVRVHTFVNDLEEMVRSCSVL